MTLRQRAAVALLLLAAPIVVGAQSGYTPVRVFDGARNRFSDFEAMTSDVARADVLFIGEQHDSAESHRLELALLEGLARRRGQIILSLEMFDRDVQEPIEHYLMGHLADADFIDQARAWPNYTTAYKPLVDLAMTRKWPVVAANAPRVIAGAVAEGGLDALRNRPDTERSLFARELRCPFTGTYFRRFREASLPDATPREAAAQAAAIERYYLVHCMKDETMGESIAQAFSIGAMDGKRPLVVHIGGGLRSDFREGVVERALRRLPEKRMAVVSMIPVASLDQLTPDAGERRRADYLVYTLRAPRDAALSAGSSSSAP